MSRPLRDRDNYLGWWIYDNGPDHHPVTGRWDALRHGVHIGHNNAEGLKKMIDQRAHDESERRRKLENAP